jgi:cytochrome P450
VVTLAQLERDPHPHLAALRQHEPVAWISALDGWLVTRHDLVREAMRDPVRFTVEDPRFSTAQVIGPSMLSLDGAEHARHREPFVAPFRARAVRERFHDTVREEAERLVDGLRHAGGAELRRGFAGPLAAAVVTRALGLEREEVPAVIGWYDDIVTSVTEITAGRGSGQAGRAAFAQLRTRLGQAMKGDSVLATAARAHALTRGQVASNAGVLLFGGIETTEGMIANALLMLLADRRRAEAARSDPGLLDAAIEESLRLEPAAAVIDRYATRDVALGPTAIARGDLVRLSIAAANRDPAVYQDPDRFDPRRPRPRNHLAFAQGPHVCVGVHLARLETRVAVGTVLARLPGLRLDPARPAHITGLVFRKPQALHAVWDRV